MRTSFAGHCGCCLMVLFPLVATAQDDPETDFDYDDLVEELPIESPVFGPKLTFTNRSGATTTIYGQVNLTYQSFADGDETTANIVDNGNWNSRLGFTYTQPLGENTLRYRFETGLTMRNSGSVSQTNTPEWTDWQKTLLRWFAQWRWGQRLVTAVFLPPYYAAHLVKSSGKRTWAIMPSPCSRMGASSPNIFSRRAPRWIATPSFRWPPSANG